MTRGRLQPRESYKTGLHRARLKSKWKNEGSAEEKWNLLKSTIYVKQKIYPGKAD